MQRLDQSEAGATAVDRANDRFAYAQGVRHSATLRGKLARSGGGLFKGKRIESGTETATGPRDDDCAHVGVRIGFVQKVEIAVAEIVRLGIVSLRPVQGEQGYRAVALKKDFR